MVKTFKIAGIFGVLLLVLSLATIFVYLSTFLGVFSDIATNKPAIDSIQQNTTFTITILTMIGLIYSLLSLGFLYGFVALGKRFNSKMLFVTG